MGLNCMLDIRYRKKMYKKYIFKHLACSFCFYVLWTAILSSCVSCPFYYKKPGGRTLRVLQWCFLFFFLLFLFLFSLRWSVCTLYLQERITGLHFSFYFLYRLLFLDSDESAASGVAAARAVGAPLFILSSFLFSSLRLLIWVQFTFIPSCTC